MFQDGELLRLRRRGERVREHYAADAGALVRVDHTLPVRGNGTTEVRVRWLGYRRNGQQHGEYDVGDFDSLCPRRA